MNFEQIAKAWRIVGADIAGLKWDDFAKALAEQPPQQCTGCEGNPSPQNNPCALCGQPAQQEPVAWRYLTQYKNQSVWTYCAFEPTSRETWEALYTSPQQHKENT